MIIIIIIKDKERERELYCVKSLYPFIHPSQSILLARETEREREAVAAALRTGSLTTITQTQAGRQRGRQTLAKCTHAHKTRIKQAG